MYVSLQCFRRNRAQFFPHGQSRVTADMKVIKTQSESNPSYFPKEIFGQKDYCNSLLLNSSRKTKEQFSV